MLKCFPGWPAPPGPRRFQSFSRGMRLCRTCRCLWWRRTWSRLRRWRWGRPRRRCPTTRMRASFRRRPRSSRWPPRSWPVCFPALPTSIGLLLQLLILSMNKLYNIWELTWENMDVALSDSGTDPLLSTLAQQDALQQLLQIILRTRVVLYNHERSRTWWE